MALVSYNDSDMSDDDEETETPSPLAISTDNNTSTKSEAVQMDSATASSGSSSVLVESEKSMIPSSTLTTLSGHISDDEDDMPSSSGRVEPNLADLNDSVSNFVHNQLPQPKTEEKVETGLVLDDTLEDEVKPKQSQMIDAPKPPPKRTKQPVKITIPKLTNDEDDEPRTKKARIEPSTRPSGLTSLLPPPVHGSKKESNRILVPHTLTKKSQPKPVAQVKKPLASAENVSVRKMTAFQAMTGYESDSDEEDSNKGNFFSLEAESENDKDTSHASLSKNLPPSLSTAPEIVQESNELSSNSNLFAKSKININPDAPLGFNSTYQTPYSTKTVQAAQSLSTSYNDYPATAASVSTTYSDYPATDQSYVSSDYSSQYQELSQQDSTTPIQQQPDCTDYLQDEQFLRLQGKRQRGKEEIFIIDANVNDKINKEIEITKTLTEESEYRAHRKKDNQPSSKEKRKHQITYLAFQAKERELELKNAWAQGRATKKQTQSKYGF